MTERKSKTNWPLVTYFGITILLIGGGAFVGFVKLAAWWRIAFGSC